MRRNTALYRLSFSQHATTRRDASAEVSASVVAQAPQGPGDEDAVAVAEVGEDEEDERGDGRVIEVGNR